MNTETAPAADQTVDYLTYTAEVRKAILNSDHVTLRFKRTTSWGEGAVEITCVRKKSDDDFVTGSFQCRAFIRNGTKDKTRRVEPKDGFPGWTEYDRDEANLFRPQKGTWGLDHMSQPTHWRAVFKTLPLGAKLTFHVCLDYATNGFMAEAGLHGDVLQLEAIHKAGSKNMDVLKIDLDHDVVQHCSVRFGWTP